MYTDKDEEMALKAITDYMRGNNVPEHYAFTTEPFKPNDFPVPEDVVSRDIRTAYGVNLITMANVLKVQDIFFTEYMKHISRYLYYLGIKCYFSSIRPSDYCTAFILSDLMHNKSNFTDTGSWNPNVKWEDLKYTDNVKANRANPINAFYFTHITIMNPNKDFVDSIKYMAGGLVHEGKDNSVTIQLLPALNVDFLVEFTKQIHKFF